MKDRYTGTILKGTNRLITSSSVEFSSLREDSYIILEGQTSFYKIIGKEKNLYIKPAEVIDQNTITIQGEDRYKFCLNDIITFTHKQYTINSVSVDPERRGAGYKVDDILNLKFTEGILSNCGTFSLKSYDGSEEHPSITVVDVNEDGGILEVKVSSGGVYNSLPDSKLEFDSGLSLNVELRTFDKRVMEERIVKSIYHELNTTKMELDHPLPERFRQGKISTYKWELLLHVNYAGEDSLDCNYRICKDFTPNYNLPLMHQGALTNESAYNESLSIIDMKLKELEDKINPS